MILCGTFIVMSIKDKSYNDLYEELKDGADMTYLGVIEPYLDPNLYNSWESFQEKIHHEIVVEVEGEGKSVFTKDKNVYILDLEKNALLYPVFEDKEKEAQYKDRFYYREVIALRRGEQVTSLITKSSYSESDYIKYGAYAKAIDYNKDLKYDYLLYIEKPVADIDENLKAYINIIIISVILSIVLSIVFGFLFSNSLTNPIIALTKSAKTIAGGNLTEDSNLIKVMSDDEIGELTQTFNHMAVELSKTMSEIYSEKNKLETVFAHMADGILVFNFKGELIHANPAAYNMLGLNIADKPFELIMGNLIDDIRFDEILNLDTESLITHMLAINDKYLNACFATYIDRSNDSVGVITVLQDITEQKKLEEMQKEFVANVSHELRTPITTIKSYTETLLSGAMEDQQIAENFLTVINNESDRMTTLVQDLLELSRLDNKQIKFNMKKMNLTKLIEESYDKYKILADKNNQKMTYSTPNDDFYIIGDPHRVEQVIKNVISNAVKYSPEEAEIDIDITGLEESVMIAIKDTGMGIPDEDIDRIFERFYRVDKARSRAMGGTGLGLAIVKEIVEHHGGTIEVESTYGKGTIFRIRFPLETVI